MILKAAFILLLSGMFASSAHADIQSDVDRALLVQSEINSVEKDERQADQQRVELANQEMDKVQGIGPAFEPESGSVPPSVSDLAPAVSQRDILNDQGSSFSVNTLTFYNNSSESHNTRTVSGVWGGVEGEYTYHPYQGSSASDWPINYFSLDFIYATGKNDLFENEQRLSDSSTTRLQIKNIPGYMFDNRLLLGKDIVSTPHERVTPYTGLGIRYTEDQAAGHYNAFDEFLGSPVVALGYDFSDLYCYLPVGLTVDMATGDDYEVSLNVEWDILLQGYERDEYADTNRYTVSADNYSSQNFKYILNHGDGFRTSLKLLKHLQTVDFYFEPYLHYWQIGASKTSSGSVGGGNFVNAIGRNSTLELGSSLGIQF